MLLSHVVSVLLWRLIKNTFYLLLVIHFKLMLLDVIESIGGEINDKGTFSH